MAKPKANAAAAVANAQEPANVRLFRLQDRFLTDPMTQQAADEIMDGYPDEYEVYAPAEAAAPVAAQDEQAAENVQQDEQQEQAVDAVNVQQD